MGGGCNRATADSVGGEAAVRRRQLLRSMAGCCAEDGLSVASVHLVAAPSQRRRGVVGVNVLQCRREPGLSSACCRLENGFGAAEANLVVAPP